MTSSHEIQNPLDAALFFAERGFRVAPIANGQKYPPVLKRWQETASSDPDTVVRWWAQEYRGANLAVLADALIVLDVDTLAHGKGDKDGLATLEALEAEHRRLPDTFTVRTATGGLHMYFRAPDGDDTFTKGADKLGPGLDVQTGNAYLVGPGSITANGVYQVVKHGEIAELPDWVRFLIRDVKREYVKPERSAGDRVNNRYVSSAIKGELARLGDLQSSGWGGPPWDQTTYEVACNLIEISNGDGSDYPLNTAYTDFMAHAPVDEKFNARQHEAKWRSAQRKVGGYGRIFPAEKGSSSAARPPAPPAPPAPPTADDEPLPPVEDYFGKNGLKVALMAEHVRDDFAVGPDRELWRYSDGIYEPDEIQLLRRVTQRLHDRYRPGHFNAVKDYVRALPDLPWIQTEQPDHRFIILSNGVYSWQELELLPHDPKYRAITKLPIEYDEDAECPAFDQYLEDVVPADTIPLVWELLGYLLMFGNPLQVSVILQGPGGNGKSTLLRVIQHLLGKQNISALSLRQIAEDRFALAGLVGKTANLAGDIDSKYLSDSSRFKQVVGGDLIEVERKFGQPFSFEPYAVPVFSANEFWKTGDTTHGYFRRWLPIPFPYSVVGKRQLDERDLFAEVPGIFNRAMVGLRTLMARGKFAEPRSVVELREKFEAAADVLSDWFDEDEHISIADPERTEIRVGRTKAYEAFQAWCRRTGHKGMASTNFYKRLGQLGYGETKSNGTRLIMGLEVTVRDPSMGIFDA